MSTSSVVSVPLASLRMDPELQARVGIYEDVAREYGEAYKADRALPPGVSFFDGETYWLADGFHRAKGRMLAGFDDLEVEVREGSKRDAILFACAANQGHGLRRTNADKRAAVRVMLIDKEWSQWSDGRIAEHCGVSVHYVGELSNDMTPHRADQTQRLGKDGRTTNTKNIGKGKSTFIGGKSTPQKPRVEAPKQESLPYAELCARCKRVGAVVGCKTCQEMGKGQPAGGETEACPEPVQEVQPDHVVEAPKQDAAPAPPRRPFDFKPLEGHVEGLRRQIDLLSAFYDQLGVDSPGRMHLYRKVDEILFDAVAWNKELMQKEVSV